MLHLLSPPRIVPPLVRVVPLLVVVFALVPAPVPAPSSTLVIASALRFWTPEGLAPAESEMQGVEFSCL